MERTLILVKPDAFERRLTGGAIGQLAADRAQADRIVQRQDAIAGGCEQQGEGDAMGLDPCEL